MTGLSTILAAAAMLAPGLALAADDIIHLHDVSAIHYYHCTVSGGQEVMDDRNGIRQCWLSDSEYIQCSTDYSQCDLFEALNAYPIPDPRGPTGPATTGTTTQAGSGASGHATSVDGTLQLQN